MPNKIQIILAVSVIVACLLANAFLVSPTGMFTQGENQDKQMIKIGAALPLTGKTASYGEWAKNGIEIAVDEVNAGQKDFQLQAVFEDTQGEPKNAVTAAKKMIEVDNAKIILAVRSDEMLAIAPITEAKKIILFSPYAGAEEITTAGDFVFRNRETASLHGKKIAEFISGTGIKKTAVLAANSSNGLTYGNSFKTRFIQLGGVIAYYAEYNQDETDFRTEIEKLKQTSSEAV
ncbi:MAG: ABC transporter substrate-binding protein, partial [Candidatus ainarchaeum sp.]|nr:ABC transporter substrate-binding protein [Candidatus ainarchaeum sp.]